MVTTTKTFVGTRLSTNNFLDLSGSDTESSDGTYFPSGPATNTTFEVGSAIADGQQSHVALFRSVEGYSKFGTYKGAGNSGVFVYTGHRPKMVWLKNIDASGSWMMFDAVRDTTTKLLTTFKSIAAHLKQLIPVTK